MNHIISRWLVLLVLASFLVSACSDPPRRGRGGENNSKPDVIIVTDVGHFDTALPDVNGPGDDVTNPPDVQTHPDTSADTSTDTVTDPDVDVVPDTCGNGFLNANEHCDPAIVAGVGACPTSCESDDSCSVARLVGSPGNCTARCVFEPITTCTDDDGCCTNDCDFSNDNDCSDSCGDGVLDGSEHCDWAIEDGPGACPTSCAPINACTGSKLVGSAANCTARCVADPVIVCRDNDGCCAPGCNANGDNDCSPICGNGVIEAGELCDGNCPTSCTANSGCTKHTLTGSAANCDAKCTTTTVTTCTNNDSCCPNSCTNANDNDCTCVPKTCPQLGVACGMTDNGCGTQIPCPTCPNGGTCVAGQCQAAVVNTVGNACFNPVSCDLGADAICASGDFKDGYCTKPCSTHGECSQGAHCGGFTRTVCMKTCTLDTNCRDGYKCFDADKDGRKECWPSGVGTKILGDSCTAVWQCGGGNSAACLTDFEGEWLWPGGYCSLLCDASTSCPAESSCYLIFANGTGVCVKNCTSQIQCRANYYCDPIDDSTSDVCIP
ncbi:MAG: hypothetical protein H0U74_18700 [Bradymonadaceae bacterium]|nr:hypothetical protein [Lujinxingiaceae bacterium]